MTRRQSRSSSSGSSGSIEDWVIPMPIVSNQQISWESEPIRKIDIEADTASWRSLFIFTTREHSAAIGFSAISTILAGLLKPTAAIFFGNIFSILAKFGGGTLDANGMLKEISTWCLALTILGLAAWVFEGFFLSAWIIFGELQAKSVRQKMFTGMLDKEMEWYDLREDGIGSLLIRIQT